MNQKKYTVKLIETWKGQRSAKTWSYNDWKEAYMCYKYHFIICGIKNTSDSDTDEEINLTAKGGRGNSIISLTVNEIY